MGPHEGETFSEALARDALEALDWNWGDAYEIGRDEDVWHARRRDGLGGVITAADPEELRNAIRDDYMIKAVPRDVHRDQVPGDPVR